MQYSAQQLKNGAKMLLVPTNGTEAGTILVFFRVGSRYESAGVIGGSHFLEHMLFKGTKKRPTPQLVSEALDAHGADYNAFTSKDYTGYYIKIVGEKLPFAVEFLHDMIFHSRFDAAELKRERGVIVEEINMYEDNPRMHVGDLLENALFDGSTLGRDIAGTRESVRNMKREDLVKYHASYYIPSRMLVVLAGKISEEAQAKAAALFGRETGSSGKDPGFASFEPKNEGKIRIGRQEKATEQVQLSLGFYGRPYGANDIEALQLLSVILGEGMSSRLFVEVREKRGLAYSVRTGLSSYEDTGSFEVHAGLSREKFPLAMATIKKELLKMKKYGPTAAEMKRAKDHIAGRILLHLEDSEARAEWYGRQALFVPNDVKTPEEWLRRIRATKGSAVTEMAREVIAMNRLSVGVVGPFANDGEVLEHLA